VGLHNSAPFLRRGRKLNGSLVDIVGFRFAVLHRLASSALLNPTCKIQRFG